MATAADTRLQFELTLAYGEFTLQAAATLAGGVTGVFGPSGAGKSTLLALLAGLVHPTHGRVQFDGQWLNDSVRGLYVPPWQRHFGVVFQEDRLFPHLRVRGNLLYGMRHGSGRTHDAATPSLDTVTALLELQPLLQRRPAQLSGGERQRVALGRALLAGPRLLLLDEPLSSLDTRLKQQILPFLKRIKEETRLPMLYVSHDARELDYLADDVLTISEGQLNGPGSTPPLPGSPSRP